MKVKVSKKAARLVSKAASRARSRQPKPTTPPKESNLGRQIFVYNHLQTNQVVYSLTKALRALGLQIFQKLREYRKLHETRWPASLALDPKTNRPLTRQARGRLLCDQKANSVADMAAALSSLTLRREIREVEVDVEQEDAQGKKVLRREVRHRKVVEPLVRATVQWRDILDAEFARAWPKTVVHDRWVTTFNNRRARIAPTELRAVGGGGEDVLLPVTNEAGKVEL